MEGLGAAGRESAPAVGGRALRRRAIALLAALLVLATSLALAARAEASVMPATAAAKPVKSQLRLVAFGIISISGDYEYDFGAAVETSKEGKRCRDGRKVSVFRDEPAGADTLIGSRRTDAIFEIALVRWRNPDPNLIAGDYYATVKKEVKRNGPGAMKCLADRSPTILIERPGFAP